jgi:hypothetical protein
VEVWDWERAQNLEENSHSSPILGQLWGIGTQVALTRFPITSSEPHFQRPDSHLSQCWSMTHSRCLVCGNRLVLPPSWSYRTFCHLFYKCASWPLTYNAQKGHFLTNLHCRIAHRLVRSNKVCGPYVVTLLNWTPIFEWYMARLVVKYIWRLYNASNLHFGNFWNGESTRMLMQFACDGMHVAKAQQWHVKQMA